MKWVCKSFTELLPHELYAALRLRNEVFVVEQNCVFQDADDKDQFCHHLFLWDGTILVAYARLMPLKTSYPNYISIGRIVNAPAYRGRGWGKLLVAKAIEHCNQLFGVQPIKIGAQLYLKTFYEAFGFKQVGDEYLEDDIKHITMILMQHS
jgi:ElaA protein